MCLPAETSWGIHHSSFKFHRSNINKVQVIKNFHTFSRAFKVKRITVISNTTKMKFWKFTSENKMCQIQVFVGNNLKQSDFDGIWSGQITGIIAESFPNFLRQLNPKWPLFTTLTTSQSNPCPNLIRLNIRHNYLINN